MIHIYDRHGEELCLGDVVICTLGLQNQHSGAVTETPDLGYAVVSNIHPRKDGSSPSRFDAVCVHRQPWSRPWTQKPWYPYEADLVLKCSGVIRVLRWPAEIDDRIEAARREIYEENPEVFAPGDK